MRNNSGNCYVKFRDENHVPGMSFAISEEPCERRIKVYSVWLLQKEAEILRVD